ncbi:MAG: glutaredoxin domain-containing protein [Candidatus Anstonellaceae archaeon]
MEDPELEKIKALKMQKMRSSIINQKEENQKNGKLKVEVYSTPTCPYCHMLKQYLKSKGIEFEDIDVSKNIEAARYMVSQTGQMGVPQININGYWIIGFDRARIEYILEMAGK